MRRLLWVFVLGGCSEYVIDDQPPPPPADPPGVDPDADFGQPPDWQNCQAGYFGQYFNLSADEPGVAPAEGEVAPADPVGLDWWDADRVAFRRYDGSLDLGENWWPVDEGVAEDPAWFSVRWTAWIRAWSGGTLSVTLGSATDAWMLIDEAVFAAQPGPHAFAPETFTVQLSAGQYPLDLRFAQRTLDGSGFRFRVLSGDVSICYPDFSSPEE